MPMSALQAALLLVPSLWLGADAIVRGFEPEALGREPSFNNISDVAPQRVLLVDVRGPTRGTGDGVRVLAMIMDLQSCGHSVEVLCDAKNYATLKGGWAANVSEQHLVPVKFWKTSQLGQITLTAYDRIILGGKLDLLYTDGQAGNAVLPVMDRLHDKRGQMREKVVVFWDDVPFERCLVKPEANRICPRVPDLVRKAAEVSHKFFVLSVGDRLRMVDHMRQEGIPVSDLDVNVWPMSMANMQKAIPSLRFNHAAPSRNLVTMMGTMHAVNKAMITTLFESGAVERICKAITSRGSAVRLVFLGGIADTAAALKKVHPVKASCVEARTGFISDEELEREIFPTTRAVLNPFFSDVNSGISVKNFESIMAGVPFLTSEYGMHGLSDEVPACAEFPMPASASDTEAFAQFVIDNVVDSAGYTSFAKTFERHAPKCIQGQLERYPPQHVC